MNSYSGPSSSPASGGEQKPRQHLPGSEGASDKTASQSSAQESSWKAGEMASRAGEMASNAASAAGAQMKGVLDNQVESGADMLHALATTVTRAAEDLDREAPQLAGLVRGAAKQLDHFASDMHDKSVDELMRSASEFTRRQPALVFGLAAVAGFLVMRTVRNASSAHMHAQDGGTSRAGHYGV